MEPTESAIVMAAGFIINDKGVNGLTVNTLARKMGITQRELSYYFRKDDDIIKYMLTSLEKEIKKLIDNLVSMRHTPEDELQKLFKTLYDFFNRKSYYLELMFPDAIPEKDTVIQGTLWRIRKTVQDYLMQILQQGMNTGAFINKVEVNRQVKFILNSFRQFMGDQRLANKMIRDLKILRESIG